MYIYIYIYICRYAYIYIYTYMISSPKKHLFQHIVGYIWFTKEIDVEPTGASPISSAAIFASRISSSKTCRTRSCPWHFQGELQHKQGLYHQRRYMLILPSTGIRYKQGHIFNRGGKARNKQKQCKMNSAGKMASSYLQ